ncbi:MAG: YkgJ family cysteine cluster protein [Candidatus Omnitrophica bacterium]|nr:YkgJ family cysteine cluster protein [Candidatus Omnitrophota bacterium]
MIKQFVPQKICLSCQGCCRFAEAKSVWSVRLLKEEKKRLRLAAYDLPLIPASAHQPYVCVFFMPCKNKCLEYATRPFECRLYPFLLNRFGNKVVLAVDTHCPFVQKTIHSKKFSSYAAYLAKLFLTGPYLALLKDNVHIAGCYPDAVNLKELFSLT